MSKIAFFLFTIILSFPIFGQAQIYTLNFLADFNDAKDLAIKEDKNIFVYVSSERSVHGKKMDKDVFTRPQVIDFFGKRFISVKLDGERRGRSFARKHQVYGYPTIIFMTPEGKELHRIEGVANEERLIAAADMSFRNPKKQAEVFKDDYRKYKNDPYYLKDYIQFSEAMEDYDLADKLADQYAKNIKKVDSLEWMDFVLRYVYKEDSKLFKLLKKNRVAFNNVYGEETINSVLVEIAINTEMYSMYDPKTQKLVDKTKKKIKKYGLKYNEGEVYPALASRVFNLEIPFANDDARADFAVHTLKHYSDKVEEKIIPTMIANVAIQKDDKSSLTVANNQVDKLIEKKPSTSLYDVKSILLYKLGEKEESYRQVALAQKYASESNIAYKSSLQIMKKSGLIE